MNKKLHTTLLFSVLLLSSIMYAGKFYWVGGTGQWDNVKPSNWSAVSGGSGGFGVPGQNDTAYFDFNSFTNFGQGVTIIGVPLKIHTIDFTGSTYSPSLIMGKNDKLEVYGSLILNYGVLVNVNGASISFKSKSSGNVINLFNNQFDIGSIVFDGVGGSWTLKDSVKSNAIVDILAGKLITNGFSFHCKSLNATTSSNQRGLVMSPGSKIYITSTWDFTTSNAFSLSMSKGSSIILSNPGNQTNFYGGSLNYANVSFNGKAGNINGQNYFDTLSVYASTALNIPNSNDIQHLNVLMSYGVAGVSTSINGGSSEPTVLYDLDGGTNCLNYTNISGIDAQGVSGTTFSTLGGTTSGIVKGFTTGELPSMYPDYSKPSSCKGGDNAEISVTGLGGIPPYKVFWDPANIYADTIKTAIGGTSYTVTLSDACFRKAITSTYADELTDDIVSPFTSVNPDNTICLGEKSRMIIAGSKSTDVNYSWSPTTNINSTTNDTVIVSPKVSTTYTVTMTFGTCFKKLTEYVVVDKSNAVIAQDTITICEGQLVTIDANKSVGVTGSGVWGNYASTWDVTDSLNPKFIASGVGGTTYFMTIYTEVCGTKIDSVYVNVLDSVNKIFGNATYNNGLAPIKKGYVFLYKDSEKGKGKWSVVDSVPLTKGGNYSFDSKKTSSGRYVIRVFPDKVLYPLLSPMYYLEANGNNDTCTYYWDSAQVVQVYCADILQKNIDIDELPDLNALGGKAKINGTIREGIGYVQFNPKEITVMPFTAGQPIGGVGVGLGKKPNPSANMVVSTTTDTSGFYQFDNLPPGDYVIFADIAGLPMDSTYEIHIAGADSVPNKNYFVNDSIVYIESTTGIFTPSRINISSQLKAYPNPYNASITFTVRVDEKSLVTLDVYNILGEKMTSLENANLNEGNYKYVFENDKAGIYIVKLTVNNKVFTQRIIETE